MTIAKSSNKHWPSIATMVAILTLLVILIGFMFVQQTRLSDFMVSVEHRLTALETQLNGGVGRFGQATDIGGYQWETRGGVDKAPNGEARLAVQIQVLDPKYQWSCGSPTVVVRDGVEADLATIIKRYSEQTDDALAIIVVGMASMEGANRGNEETLALNRIKTLLGSIDENLGHRDLPLYGYWLGQYAKGQSSTCRETGELTAVQRRVVLLKVLSWDPSVSQNTQELEYSINRILVDKAIRENQTFAFDIRQYSRILSRQRVLYSKSELQLLGRL